MPKRRLLAALVVAAGAAVCVAAAPFVAIFASQLMIRHREQDFTSDAQMQKVGRSLALYASSLTRPVDSSAFGVGWLPAELADLAPSYASVGPGEGVLGFGGGFHHAAYALQRIGDGHFSLSFTSEDDWTPARTIRFAPTPRVDEAAIVEQMKDSYRVYAAKAGKGGSLHVHVTRLRFVLGLGTSTELRDAAHDMLRANEGHVGARYASAVVDGATDANAAARSFGEWVTEHPGFRHSTILVAYLVSIGRPVEAKRWATTAVAEALVDPKGTVDAMWNYSALGVTLVSDVVTIDPDLAVRLCDKIENEETEQSSRTYFKPALEALRRRAIEIRAGHIPPAAALDPEVVHRLDFDREFLGTPTFREDLRALMAKERDGG